LQVARALPVMGTSPRHQSYRRRSSLQENTMAKTTTAAAPVRDFTARITTSVIPVELIDNHPDNYNFHPEAQLADLKASYTRRGQFRSMLVWARPGGRFTLVVGEGFTTGAKRGGAPTIRCEVLPEDTPPEYVREILLADNLHARNSVPDDELLLRLLQEEQDQGHDLASLGSSEDEIDSLLLFLEQTTPARTNGPQENDGPARASSVSVFVNVSSLAMIEQALVATGEATRGTALEEICTFYLERHEAG
jgi:hypothetical protein